MKLNELSYSLRLALSSMAFVTCVSASLPAFAFGLGKAHVRTGPGQIMIADVDLLTDPSELSSLRMSLALAAEYQAEGIEFNPVLFGARVSLKKAESGKTTAQIVTRTAVNDNYLQVILFGETASGKFRKTYTLELDSSNTRTDRLPGESVFSNSNALSVSLPSIKSLSSSKPSVKDTRKNESLPLKDDNRVLEIEFEFTNITQKGVPPARIDKAKGFGHDQAINKALFSIVPKGWKGYSAHPNENFYGTTSWQGNKNWLIVLDGVLSSAQMFSIVDWNKKEVTFSNISNEPIITETNNEAVKAQSTAPLQTLVALKSDVDKVSFIDLSNLTKENTGEKYIKGRASNNFKYSIKSARLIDQLGISQTVILKLNHDLEVLKLSAVDFKDDNGFDNKRNAEDISLFITKQLVINESLNRAIKILSNVPATDTKSAANNNKKEELSALSFQVLQSELNASRLNAINLENRVNFSLNESARYSAQVKGLSMAFKRAELNATKLMNDIEHNVDLADARRLLDQQKSLKKAILEATDQINSSEESNRILIKKIYEAQNNNNTLEMNVIELKLKAENTNKNKVVEENIDLLQVDNISVLEKRLANSQSDLIKAIYQSENHLVEINQLKEKIFKVQTNLDSLKIQQSN